MKKLTLSAMIVLGISAPAFAAPGYAEAVDEALSVREVQVHIYNAKVKYKDHFGMSINFMTIPETQNLGMVLYAGPAEGQPSETADSMCLLEWDSSGNVAEVNCGPNPEKKKNS